MGKFAPRNLGETVVFDWYLRTDEIGEAVIRFCHFFEIEQVKYGEGWIIMRCKTREQRRALQMEHHQQL
jgi:hypothetical protein